MGGNRNRSIPGRHRYGAAIGHAEPRWSQHPSAVGMETRDDTVCIVVEEDESGVNGM